MSRVRQAGTVVGLVLLAVMVFGLASVGASPAVVVVSIANPLPESGARFGVAVDGLEDIDSDGVGDLAVGASGADRVFLFSGNDQSLIRILEHPDGLTGLNFGLAVRGVGDLDGDTVEDVAVGTPGPELFLPLPCISDPCLPAPEQGRVFVFSGADGSLIFSLVPDGLDFLSFGAVVAPLSDVNYDGIPDVAAGAPAFGHASPGQAPGGSVYAFSGANGSQLWVTTEFSPPRPSETLLPSLGIYLADIADVDGDGLRDLLAPAPFTDVDPDPTSQVFGGKGYVLSGASGTIFRIHNAAPSPGNGFGAGPATIGDQDGDGLVDYVFGEEAEGKIRLFRGSDGALLRVIDSPAGGGDGFGRFLAGVDDKDADGRDDFWVAAPEAGIIYLMNRFGDVIEQVDLSPGNIGIFAGRALSATADLDGDASEDVIVGKPFDSVGAVADAGAVLLIFVSPQIPIVCPLGQGYWYNHTDAWPGNTVEVGKETYGKGELLNLARLKTKRDASLKLSRQLVAAKLNVTAGADPAPIQTAMADADALLTTFTGKLPYDTKTTSTKGVEMVPLTELLDAYNNGELTPGCEV